MSEPSSLISLVVAHLNARRDAVSSTAVTERETTSSQFGNGSLVQPRAVPHPNRPVCGNGRLMGLIESLPTNKFTNEAEAEAAIAAKIRNNNTIPLNLTAGDIMLKLWHRNWICIDDDGLTITPCEHP